MKLIALFCLFVLVQSRTIDRRIVRAVDGSKVICFHCENEADREWFSGAVFYQIYPKSFKDSNNDGYGDLQGIAEKLIEVKELGADGIWLSPCFKSPQKDGGYDISDFYSIDPIFGTMEDMEYLILTAKRLKIKIILDFVPNHTSDEHEWFVKSVENQPGFEDYYVWLDGKNCKDEPWLEEDGVPCDPPNNWLSVFSGSAWEWNWSRNKFYLHQFDKGQPDLNYNNPRVKEELKNILRFWMAKGIDGFRVDAINHAFEDESFEDEVMFDPENGDPTEWSSYYHNYTKDLPGSYELVYDWRDLMDEFSLIREIDPKVMMTEAYSETFEGQFRWFGEGRRLGSHIAFNFLLVGDLSPTANADYFALKINEWLDAVPNGNEANWVAGNHDQPRIASKWGSNRAEQVAFLVLTLPGIGIVYYGEEIGMVDHREISWADTQDPSACASNDTYYKVISRDPVRTPMQWDATANGGFNEGAKSWLPVHPDYESLNLAAAKEDPNSIYYLYKNLIRLRKLKVFQQGKYVVRAFYQTNVLGVLRYLENEDETYAVLVNLGNTREIVDLTTLLPNRTSDLKRGIVILATSTFRTEEPHPVLRTTNFNLESYQAVIVKLLPDE